MFGRLCLLLLLCAAVGTHAKGGTTYVGGRSGYYGSGGSSCDPDEDCSSGAGIIILVIVGVIVFCCVVGFLMMWCSKRSKSSSSAWTQKEQNISDNASKRLAAMRSSYNDTEQGPTINRDAPPDTNPDLNNEQGSTSTGTEGFDPAIKPYHVQPAIENTQGAYPPPPVGGAGGYPAPVGDGGGYPAPVGGGYPAANTGFYPPPPENGAPPAANPYLSGAAITPVN